MWTHLESALRGQAITAMYANSFQKASRLADELLDLVKEGGDPTKKAYVLWLQAEILRHFKYEDAARLLLREAFDIAKGAQAYAAAAYILRDLSVMEKTEKKEADMLGQVIKLLGRANTGHNPDSYRSVEAEMAYTQARLARIWYLQGKHDQAKELIQAARGVLKRYATRVPHSYIKAYLFCLLWASRMYEESEERQRLEAVAELEAGLEILLRKNGVEAVNKFRKNHMSKG